MTVDHLVRSIEWQEGELLILDQTRLPHETVIEKVIRLETLIDCIKKLKVRGAPAIGIAAAYGMVVGLPVFKNIDDLRQELLRRAEELIRARPTAVNLSWAVQRMLECFENNANNANNANSEQRCQPPDLSAIGALLEEEAVRIHEEDAELCHRIGLNGLPLVEKYPHILTHCNAGAFAVSRLGTALAPIYMAHEKGINVHVFVDETRPLLQGARLTAFELGQVGVPLTLITDSMAASVMQQGKVDMVLVGADRIALNGDVANKVGTLSLAVLCAHFGIPFYVAAPSSTVDLSMICGDGIVIEERDAREVTYIGGRSIAPADVKVFNPAFDVTPADLITGVITDKGILTTEEISAMDLR